VPAMPEAAQARTDAGADEDYGTLTSAP
jgi:hypothetical protein